MKNLLFVNLRLFVSVIEYVLMLLKEDFKIKNMGFIDVYSDVDGCDDKVIVTLGYIGIFLKELVDIF